MLEVFAVILRCRHQFLFTDPCLHLVYLPVVRVKLTRLLKTSIALASQRLKLSKQLTNLGLLEKMEKKERTEWGALNLNQINFKGKDRLKLLAVKLGVVPWTRKVISVFTQLYLSSRYGAPFCVGRHRSLLIPVR